MKTYTITYQNHDQGAAGGSMIRESLERAEFTARLMKECGYQLVIITENK